MSGTITVKPKFSINSVSASAVSPRSSNLILQQQIVGARKYRFLLYPSPGQDDYITGNTGIILNLPLKLDNIDKESMKIATGAYDVVLDNIIISGKENLDLNTVPTSKGIIVVGASNENNPLISPNQIASLKENPAKNTYFYKVQASDADINSFLDDHLKNY